MSGLLQTLAIMAFQSSLSSVLLMSSLLGDSDYLCILCVVSLCFWYHKSFHKIFAFLFDLLCLYAKKNCSCLLMMVLRKYLLYPAFPITSWFDFIHDILIIHLMYHIYAASSLLSRSLVSVQHSHPCRRVDHNYVGFQSVDFGINLDIAIGEVGLHLDECVFRQSYFFLYFCVASGVWSYCEAQLFKSVYLFYSFPFAKNVTYRNKTVNIFVIYHVNIKSNLSKMATQSHSKK